MRLPLLLMHLLLLLSALVSCTVQDSRRDIENPALPPTAFLQEASQNLPALASLDIIPHEISLAGPGWYELPITVPASYFASSNTVNGLGGNSLLLDGNPGASAYVVFAVSGFDGDSFPSSLRLDVDPVGGSYYVAFPDYPGHRWRTAGPFEDDEIVELDSLVVDNPRAAFLSAGNVFYCAVLSSQSFRELFKVEVGVHSGISGPRPPASFPLANNGETRLNLYWTHSPDYLEPDFAGYMLERAPSVFGEFLPLYATAMQANTYLDEGLAADTTYRYRVAAVDLAGNMSPWRYGFGTTISGTLADPLAVVDLPGGTLFAPAAIRADLTGSSDPEGHDIVAWRYSTAENSDQDLPDGEGVLFFNPGCHLVRFSVETDDGRVGETAELLRVYPRWEDEAVTVSEGDAGNSFRQLEFLRAGVLADGSAVAAGFDKARRRFAFLKQEADQFVPYFVPWYWELDAASEMISLNGSLVVALRSDTGVIYLATFNGSEAQLTFGPAGIGPVGGTGLALVSTGNDSGLLFYVSNTNGAGALDLNMVRLSSPTFDEELIANFGSPEQLSACYEPQNDDVYLLSYEPGSLDWNRLDAQSGAVLDTENVSGSVGILEQAIATDPISGWPVAVYLDGNKYKSRRVLDDTGLMDAEADVAAGAGDFTGGSLLQGSTALFCLFAQFPDVTTIFRLKAAGDWEGVHGVSYSDNSAYATALAELPAGNGLFAADVLGSAETVLVRFPGDGSEDVLQTLPAYPQQPLNLHAAGGFETHVTYWDRSSMPGQTRHYYSTDDGDSWLGSGEFSFLENVSLGSNNLGQIYLSGNNGNNSELYWWDDRTDVPSMQAILGGPQRTVPMLRKHAWSDEMSWYVYNPDTVLMTLIRGFWAADNPLLDYISSDFNPDTTPVWGGAVASAGNTSGLLALAGSGTPASSFLVNYQATNSASDTIAFPLYHFPADFVANTYTLGRSLAGTNFMGSSLLNANVIYLSAYGNSVQPLRVEYAWNENTSQQSYEMAFDPYVTDARRFVSADTAHGATGLVLLSDWDGTELIFQWSNLGDWENIPLPHNTDRMFMPEITVDDDGRWYIFYVEPASQAVRVIRTVIP